MSSIFQSELEALEERRAVLAKLVDAEKAAADPGAARALEEWQEKTRAAQNAFDKLRADLDASIVAKRSELADVGSKLERAQADLSSARSVLEQVNDSYSAKAAEYLKLKKEFQEFWEKVSS